ncbi:hypothetical protein H5P28_10580, partial [Ruficoccus amylovorans]
FEQLSTATREQILEHCPTSFLQLDENWDRKNSHAGLDNTTIKDLVKLLSDQVWTSFYEDCVDPVWLHGDLLGQTTEIFDGINYLEPLQEVRHRLYEALEIGRSQAVVTDGFPENCFRLWVFPVRREYRYAHGYENLNRISGYNAVSIMVDRQDQVVAIECLRTSEVPDGDLRFSWEANTIHFLGLKKKFAANATVRITIWEIREYLGKDYVQRASPGQSVHVTEVNFYSSNKKPLSYSRMYMPDRLARLIAYNIGTNWSRRPVATSNLDTPIPTHPQRIRIYK